MKLHVWWLIFLMLPPKKNAVIGIVHFTCNITKPNFQGIFPSPVPLDVWLLPAMGYSAVAGAVLANHLGWWKVDRGFATAMGSMANPKTSDSCNWESLLSELRFESKEKLAFTTGNANNHPTNSVRNQMAIKLKWLKQKSMQIQVKQKLLLKFEQLPFPSIWNTPSSHVILGLWSCGSKFKALNLPTFKVVSI